MDSLFYSLGFYPRAPLKQLDRIFDNVVQPLIAHGRTSVDAANLALFLETSAYEILVKASETEEAFRTTYAAMQPALTAIGNAPFARLARPAHEPSPRPVVAFWLPGAGILAHTQQLLTLLRALKEMENPPISPIVYIGAPTAPPTQKVFEATGWPVAFVGDWPHRGQMCPPMELMDRLAKRCQQDNVSALVFVSTPIHMLTAVAMNVAPVTVWWSMKWHSLDVPGLDLRLTPRRGDFVEMGGYRWTCGHVCLPRLANPDQARQRERLRKQYKLTDNQVVFGFMGREDKLTPEYGDAIATLLEAHQNAAFVFTGRQRVQAFEERLKSVANRVRFIGWVDVESVVWALDVYADSFPMGSGHTAFAAMQAGIPVVTLMTPLNQENSAASHISQLITGNGVSQELAEEAMAFLIDDDTAAYPGVPSQDEFHYRLCQLAASPDLRARIGARQKAFVEKYMMDSERYATQTSMAIIGTIAKKLGVEDDMLLPAPTYPELAAAGKVLQHEKETAPQARAKGTAAGRAPARNASKRAGGGRKKGSAKKPRGSSRQGKRKAARS